MTILERVCEKITFTNISLFVLMIPSLWLVFDESMTYHIYLCFVPFLPMMLWIHLVNGRARDEEDYFYKKSEK